MFETSESTVILDEVLAKAQSEIGGAVKSKTNPFFKSKYADLAAVWEACRESLTKNGISVTQWLIHSDDNRLHLMTRIAHKGEWMRGHFSMPVSKLDAQSYGSAATYAKRFALASAVGVISEDEEDDDAEGAMDRKEAINITGKPYNGFPKTDNPGTSSGKDGFISESQGKRLYAIYKAKGLSDNEMKSYLFDKFGIKTSKEISRRNYESIVEWVNNFNRIDNADDILQEDVFPGVND